MSTLSTTWQHLRRSPYQSLVLIMVMFSNMFLLSLFLFLGVSLYKVTTYYETKPEITIFLKDGLDKSAIDSIQKELSDYKEIKEIRYISKEKALENYKEQNKDKPALLELVTASILPSSFEITASNQEVLSQIAKNFSIKNEIVDEVVYPEDIIKPLLQFTSSLKKVGLISILYSSLVSFFLATSAIGQKIISNKDEIRVSRLLGASKGYVSSPFVVEGIVYGLISASLGFALSFFIFFQAKDTLNSFFNPIVFFNPSSLTNLQIAAATLLFAMTLGMFSALVGTRRHIKF